MDINEKVRSFWEKEACGTSPELINTTEYHSKEWYDEVETYRYSVEPFIHLDLIVDGERVQPGNGIMQSAETTDLSGSEFIGGVNFSLFF